MIITINPLLNVMFRLFLFIILFSISAFSEQTPTPTPMEVHYFEIDAAIVSSGNMIFDYSGISGKNVTLTVHGVNDEILSYIVIDVDGNTTDADKVYKELTKKVPTVKNLKKVGRELTYILNGTYTKDDLVLYASLREGDKFIPLISVVHK